MNQPQKSVDDILASAKLVEKSVTLCLRGDLQAKYEEVERQLAAAMRSPMSETLGGDPEQKRLAAESEAIRAEIADAEVTFTFRALPARRWSDLMAEHPARQGKNEGFNLETLPDALIAACSVEPAMTLEEVQKLCDALSNAQFQSLFECAWSCNQTALDVPFSGLALRVLRASETS